jgi:hypothetical protein
MLCRVLHHDKRNRIYTFSVCNYLFKMFCLFSKIINTRIYSIKYIILVCIKHVFFIVPLVFIHNLKQVDVNYIFFETKVCTVLGVQRYNKERD